MNDGNDVFFVAHASGAVSRDPILYRRDIRGGAMTELATLPNGGDPIALDATDVFLLAGGTSIYAAQSRNSHNLTERLSCQIKAS